MAATEPAKWSSKYIARLSFLIGFIVSGDFNYSYRVIIHDGSTLALFQSAGMFNIVAERDDTNEEAFEQVEKATDSEPVKGEELLESEEVKRKLREAKERLKAESGNPGGE
jgi:hypothetical protein